MAVRITFFFFYLYIIGDICTYMVYTIFSILPTQKQLFQSERSPSVPNIAEPLLTRKDKPKVDYLVKGDIPYFRHR